MPVLQIVHIKAGHDMTHPKGGQVMQGTLQMVEGGDARDGQYSLAGKVIDDVRLHISFNQQDLFPNRPYQMTPVFTLDAVQLVHSA